MIWTRRCDLLGIDVPVVQPRFGPWPSLEVPAAVSNAGAGVGSIGTRLRTFDESRTPDARAVIPEVFRRP